MKSTKSAVRQSHFPGILCVVYFVSLLLMSGVHMGLVTLINTKGWNDIVAVLIPTVYWALVAVALTLYARWQIKKTFSRAQLMDEFWGIESNTSLRAVDVYVTKLRDKFAACDGFKIVTVRGLGYKAVLE